MNRSSQFNRAGDRMRHSARSATPEERAANILTLESMLDYAMIEGAELRLPKFVYLLRAARSELIRSIHAVGDPPRTATVPTLES